VAHDVAVDGHLFGRVVDTQCFAADHAALAHAAGDHCGVRRAPAFGRENAGGRNHARDVLRRRFDAHEQHVLAVRLRSHGIVGREHDHARRSAGGCAEAFCEQHFPRFRVDGRMQELIDLRGIDAQHGLFARDQLLGGHVDGDVDRGGGGALAVTGLQHPQPSAFDRELHVLHVAVVTFELVGRLQKLAVTIRHHFFEGRVAARTLVLSDTVLFGPTPRGLARDLLRRANAGDHIFTLCVDEELAEELAFAVAWVARECDPGRAGAAHVAEHHCLHVDSGTPRVGNIVEFAVDLRTVIVP
jgi:hypothetical protein